jgi:hypothetical protein
VALLPAPSVTYDAVYSIASSAFVSSQVVTSNRLVLWPPGQGPL